MATTQQALQEAVQELERTIAQNSEVHQRVVVSHQATTANYEALLAKVRELTGMVAANTNSVAEILPAVETPAQG